MKRCLPAQISDVPNTGTGAGVSVEIAQAPGDPGGWSIRLFALFRERRVLVENLAVGTLALPRRPNRILFVGGFPGADKFQAVVYPPPGALTTQPVLVVVIHCSKDLVTSQVLTT